MTLEDIKAAVEAGQTVHWANTGYIIRKDRLGQYLITCVPNGSCIGLTDREGSKRRSSSSRNRRTPQKIQAANQDQTGRGGAQHPEARGHSHSDGSSDPWAGLKGKQAF